MRAVVVSDIEGSTALWEEFPEAMARALDQHDAAFEAAIARHGGRTLRTEGDSFAVGFAEPEAAVAFLVALADELAATAWPLPEGRGLAVRWGLHVGAFERVASGRGVAGRDADLAAAVGAAARGGQRLATSAAARIARGLGVATVDLGTFRVADRVVGLHALGPDRRPPRAEAAPRTNLPAAPPRLVGRDAEVAALTSWLASPFRVVTLAGATGVGKTSLALAVAARDPASGGVWLVRATRLGREGLRHAVARVLGVPLDAGAASDLVERGSPLLVVDDPDPELGADLAELVAMLGVDRVLVTCERPLGIPDERVLWVDALPTPDAVVLLQRRVRELRGRDLEDEEPGYAHDLARRLGGNPLAIEIAAARAARSSVVDVATDLRLVSRSPWAVAIDALDAADRTRLLVATCFLGAFRADQVEDVMARSGHPRDPAAMDRLLRASLVRRDPVDRPDGPDHRVAAVVVAHLADHPDRPAVVASWGAWLVARGTELADLHRRTGEPSALEGLADLEGDLLREARQGDRAALLALDVLFSARGPRALQRRLLSEVADPDAAVCLALAAVLRASGEPLPALEAARRSLELAPDLAAQAAARSEAAVSLLIAGRQADADHEGALALELAQASGDAVTEAHAAATLGVIRRRLDQDASAAVLQRHALSLWRELGNASGELAALGNLASLALAAGDLAAARLGTERVVERARVLGATRYLPSAWSNLGLIDLLEGRDADAERRFVEAEQVADRVLAGVFPLLPRLHRGCLALYAGEGELARELLEPAVAAAGQHANQAGLYNGCHLLGVAHAMLGDRAAAEDCSRRMAAIAHHLPPVDRHALELLDTVIAVTFDPGARPLGEDLLRRLQADPRATSRIDARLIDRILHGSRAADDQPPPRGAEPTFVFARVTGLDALRRRDALLVTAALALTEAILRSLRRAHRGHEVKSEPDSWFLAFELPGDALDFCLAAQRALAEAHWAPELLLLPEARPSGGFRGLRVRMGVHRGRAHARRWGGRLDWFGPGVNTAARVAAAAHGGQVVVDGATWRAGAGSAAVVGLGEHALRGVERPVELLQVVPPTLGDRRFPPPRTGRGHGNLPTGDPPRVGRDAEIEAVVLGGPVIAVVGASGAGSSRVALEAARRLAPALEGAWWVDVTEAVTSEDLLDAVTRRVGLPPERGPDALVEALDLGGGHLILLDHADRAIDELGPWVAAFQRARRSRLLLTTREPPGAGAPVVRLGPLTGVEAVALFAQEVETAHPHLDPAALRDACAPAALATDRLPGTLRRAAAAWSGATPRVSPAYRTSR